MKGEVQVFSVVDGKDHLISKSSNLILDGLGEIITDYLTMPSSIMQDSAGGPPIDPTTYNKYWGRRQLLEITNYNIGALSFGKGTLGYRHNSHGIENINLLGKSENIVGSLASNYPHGVWNTTNGSVFVRNTLEEAADLSSKVVEVEVLTSSVNFYDRVLSQKCALRHGVMSDVDNYIFSVDLKFNFDNFHEIATDATVDSPYFRNRFSAISIGQILNNVDPSAAGAEILNEKFLVIRWDTSGVGHILTKEEDPTSDFNFGYLKNLGNGWYRASVILDPQHNHDDFGITSVATVSSNTEWVMDPGRQHTPAVAASAAGSCTFSLKSNQFSFPEGHTWYGSDDQLSAVADDNIWLEKRVITGSEGTDYKFVRVPDSLWGRTDTSTIVLSGPAAGWPTGGGGELTCANSGVNILGWDESAGEQCEVMWRPTLSSEGDIPWENFHTKSAGILGHYRLVSDSTVAPVKLSRPNSKNPKGYLSTMSLVGMDASSLGHWDAAMVATVDATSVAGIGVRAGEEVIFELFVEKEGSLEGSGHFAVSISTGTDRFNPESISEISIVGSGVDVSYYDYEDQNEGSLWHGYSDNAIDETYSINGWMPKPYHKDGKKLDEVKSWVTVHGDYYRIRIPHKLPASFGAGKSIWLSYKPDKTGFDNIGDYRLISNPRIYLNKTGTASPLISTYDIHVGIHPTLPLQAYTLTGTSIGLNVEPSSLKGSIYASRPMLSVGRFPVDYEPVTGAQNPDMPNFPMLASAVNLGNHLYAPSGQGSLYYDVSTPHPISNPPSMPSPTDSVLEEDVVTKLETYCDVDIGLTQNPNYLHFNKETSFEVNDIAVGYGIKEFGIRGNAKHLGAYAPRSGVIVNTLSSVDAFGYRTPAKTKQYGIGYNSKNRISSEGYIRAYFPIFGGAFEPVDSIESGGGVVVSATSDFSSTCQVSAISIIPKGDVASMHFYGGVFEAGLHAIDFRKNLENQNFIGLRLQNKGAEGDYQIDSKPVSATSDFCLDLSDGVIRFTTKTNPKNDKYIGIPTEDFSFVTDFLTSSNDFLDYNLKLQKQVTNLEGSAYWEDVPKHLWGYVDSQTVELSGNTELYGPSRWPLNDTSTCFAPKSPYEGRLNFYGFDVERGISDDILFKPFAENSVANEVECPIPYVDSPLPRDRGALGPYRLVKVYNTKRNLDFKMIAKKTFTDNIVAARDKGTDAGIDNFDDVKIVWRLDFN